MTEAAQLRPLAGIKVLDLGQFIAIPFCGLWLAALGAEVIVVESKKRMTSRTAPPFAEGHGKDPDASGYFNLLYSGKKSCTVDMTTAAGRDVVRQIASKVDVVVDNFSTGVLEKLGLGYDSLSAIHPGIIMVSNGAFGRTGPMKNARGLHSTVNLFSGVADVTRYLDDDQPRILGGCLPDPLSGSYSMFALMTAIHHRNRTGQGQFIDIAMYEAMMSLIPEAVIDLTMNGNEPKGVGNRDRLKAPHGIYRCRQPDSWVALSVETDAEWQALRTLVGEADWDVAEFCDIGGRLAHIARLDALVEKWTSSMDLDACVARLQEIGVASGPVLRIDELLDNKQLNERGFVVSTDHPVVGPRRQFGLPWRMDSYAIEHNPAPLLGQHTREVLTELIGMNAADYDKLEADGVLT